MDADTPGNLPEFSVSELSGAVKRTIEGAFDRVRVRGEIGRVTQAGSGHMYLSMKEENAVLDCVCWKATVNRLAHRPEQGLEMIATGRLTTYPGRSSYQLVIEHIEPAGVGALMALLEARRKIGFGLIPNLRHHLESELAHEGVRCFVQVKELALDGTSLTFSTRRDGDLRIDGVSAIVVAAGRKAIQLPEALSAFPGEVIALGDADEPGSIYEAVAGPARRWRG